MLNKRGIYPGVWDLLHPGHLFALRWARERCDVLTAALNIDPTLDNPLKQKPLESETERMTRLHACKFVDNIVTYTGESELEQFYQSGSYDIAFISEEHRETYTPTSRAQPVFVPRPTAHSSTYMRGVLNANTEGLTVHQADYRNIRLKTLASLLISSVPLQILKEDVAALFQWIDKTMTREGIVIIDMPADEQYIRYASVVANKNNWYPQWQIDLPKFYNRYDSQTLVAWTRKNVTIEKKEIEYRNCGQREMQHQCEFDPTLIECLIQSYSKPHDVIIDPFCGTGLVPRIARDMNRSGIGIDKRCPWTNEL